MGLINIIYPPTIDWNYLFQRPQQLMRSFARNGWNAWFMNFDHMIPKERCIEVPEENLHIVNHLRFYDLPMTGDRILWFSYPEHYSYDYHQKITVFDSIDEPKDEFEHWAEHYYNALRAADVVFASSQSLYDLAVSSGHKNVHLLENAADYDHFARAQSGKLPAPPDFPERKGPVIGYYGALASWVDFDLINQTAEAGYDVVIIGPWLIYPVTLHHNVTVLPQKPYTELPNYLQYFDVAIIPFKVTEMIKGCNPIKMWEYMAAGKPVVTTAIPECQKYKEIYASGDFLGDIAKALKDTKAKRDKRIKLAKANSWDARAKKAIEILGAML